MKSERALVVDHEPVMRDFLGELLKRKRLVVDVVNSSSQALRRLNTETYNLVITEFPIPGGASVDLLHEIRSSQPGSPVIVISAAATVEDAVEVMRKGAFTLVTKPFSAEVIELNIDKALDHQRLISHNKCLRSELEDRYSFGNLVGKSKCMKEVFEKIKIVAPSNASVLIQGDSGTGKELVARAIHHTSTRRDLPFVSINCAALPQGLVENELFGHERGAFTGAVKRTKGRFEMANGGTLLLDEISEISFPLQAKLLRVLQEKEFERVGNGTTLKVDVRIVATTNRNLKEEIEENRFRADLFYRLNVVPLYLPPLRERREDIRLLAEFFLSKYCKESGKQLKGFSDETMGKMFRYEWPGNVRELGNSIERAVIMTPAGRFIDPDLIFEINGSDGAVACEADQVGTTIREMERTLILKTLREEDGSRTNTAKRLGISIRTLRNKLNEYKSKECLVEDVA